MKKRIFSMVLAICMMLTLCPVITFAEGHVYRVAGDSDLCGSIWNPTDDSNLMTYNETAGRYEKVYTGFKFCGTYWYTITADGDWISGVSSAYVEVLSLGATVTIWYNETTGEYGAEVSYDRSYKKGDIIELGSYPQTKETDPQIISALNGILTDDMWVSYGYYIGTGTEYDGKMTASDYMKYADLELNGEKYRAVRFSQYRPAVTSSVSSEATSVQDDNGYELNTTYFFKYEPLTWTILDPDEGLVISNMSIDAQAFENVTYYSESEDEVYNSTDCTNYANDWSVCSLREWMNKDFFNTAFTAEEQARIEKTHLENKSLFDQKYDCADTEDKIFLLSLNDAINSDYGFNTSVLASDLARKRPATDYAKCQGAVVEVTTETFSYWWLRTTIEKGVDVFAAATDGHLFSSSSAENYHVNRTDVAVVPAFKVNLNAVDISVVYDLDGGAWADGYTAPISYKSDETLALPTAENVFKPGYTFSDWEQTSFIDNTVSYKAQWTAKTYTVKFDTRGGTELADKTLYWDDKVLDGVVSPTRDGGFEFDGWDIVSPKLSATTLNCTYGELVLDDSIDSVTLGAVWKDVEAPTIIGLENSKTYCGAQKFKVTDNNADDDVLVTANGKVLEIDTDGYYTAEPTSGEIKITAADSSANSFTVTITVNAAHDYGDWKFNENEHWKECSYGDSVIEKGEHTFEWVTDKEATENETGIAHEECSVCHAKRNENTVISKLPSKLDKLEAWLFGILSKIIKWIVEIIDTVC